jgi:hypothetical protein
MFELSGFFRHALNLMRFRPAILILSAALLLAFGTGCQKSESTAPAAPPTVLSADTIASVHFLGKKRLGITAGAYYFARIWQQPQSAQLERQTLIKIASVPGEWLPGGGNLSRDGCSRLWWTLNDLLQEESYLEIHQSANGIGETVFAIRLNPAQAEQWLTNLPVVLEPLTGNRVVLNSERKSWSLKTTGALKVIQLARVGEWTLVSAGSPQNSLQPEIAARIRRDGVPFVSAATNILWLESSLDPQRLAAAFPALTGKFSTIKHFDLNISGDGGSVFTRAQLTFLEPLASALPDWHMPENLVHEPLISFTAARGVQSLLASWPEWNRLQITAPDQFYLWSLSGSPGQTYLAAPLPDAAHQIPALADRLLQNANPWLATNGYVSFDRPADSNGVTWGNQPELRPFIKFAGTPDDGWLYAGLLADTNSAALPPPAGMIQDILSRTNLVYYDWEVTGPRLQPCFYLAQTARQIARRPQLAPDSVAAAWLGMLAPRLGTSATIITRSAPDQLTFRRRSTLGLTAPELQLLAGWLDSIK